MNGKNSIVRAVLWTGLVASCFGCGLEKIDGDTGGGSGVPPAVQERFDTYCALSSCHDGTFAPNLSAGASGAIIGQASTAGTPYVEFGNLGSQIVVRLTSPDNPMPPATSNPQPDAEDKAVIVGWVAGVMFDDTDGGMDTDGTTTAAATSDASTTSDGTTTGATTTGEMLEPTYANVQQLFTDTCATASCHDGTFPPELTAATAYNNIINVPSTQASGVPYVTPDDSQQSYLWHKVNGTAGDVGGIATIMPSGGMLTDAQITMIAEWIDMGAMQ